MGDVIGTGKGADPIDSGGVPIAPPADVLQLLGDLLLPTDDPDDGIDLRRPDPSPLEPLT